MEWNDILTLLPFQHELTPAKNTELLGKIQELCKTPESAKRTIHRYPVIFKPAEYEKRQEAVKRIYAAHVEEYGAKTASDRYVDILESVFRQATGAKTVSSTNRAFRIFMSLLSRERAEARQEKAQAFDALIQPQLSLFAQAR